MSSPTLHLDRSSIARGLHFEVDGKRVDLEDCFAHGFIVEPEDTPAVLTLLRNFVETRDENQK